MVLKKVMPMNKLNYLSQGTYEHFSEPLFGKPYVNNRCRDFADQGEDLEKSVPDK